MVEEKEEKPNKVSKIACIESGLYDDALSAFKEYLKSNYVNCKVCFICTSELYVKMKKALDETGVKPIYLFSDDKATLQNAKSVYKVVDNVSLLCCLDIDSISYAKMVSRDCGQDCVYYMENMPSLDAFLPLCYVTKEGMLTYEKCEPMKYYIISYKCGNEIDRESLVASVFSTIVYFGSFLELMLDTYIYKSNYYIDLKSEFVNYAYRLNNLLSEVVFLHDKFLDNYLCFMEDFSKFLIQSKINLDTKENVFGKLYKYFEPKSDLSYDEIRLVGVQAMAKVYAEFFKNLPTLSYSYYDIEKKIRLIDNLFHNVDYEIDEFDTLKAEKMNYLVRRFEKKLVKKCANFSIILDHMIDKALDLYNDSGYSFSKKMHNDTALKAIYFTPDFTKGDCFIKLVRDFGVLDYL